MAHANSGLDEQDNVKSVQRRSSFPTNSSLALPQCRRAQRHIESFSYLAEMRRLPGAVRERCAARHSDRPTPASAGRTRSRRTSQDGYELRDCNSRDRGGILVTDKHLRREESVAMKIDRIQPEGMSVRIQQGEARLFARRRGHRPG